MRYLLFFCFPVLLFSSCGEEQKRTTAVKGKTFAALPVNPERITGMYAGEFRGSPIAIVLTRITEKQAGGYNLHNGVNRSLSGVAELIGPKLHLFLAEPGDSRFDGQFHLSIDTVSGKGEGTWKSFVSGKEFPFSFQKRLIRKEGEGQVFVDKLANHITLRPDGSCLFSFLKDTSGAGQPITIRGNYKKQKTKVIIYWEKNSIYPSGKSVFSLVSERPVKGDGYTQQSLRGEGLVFSEMLF